MNAVDIWSVAANRLKALNAQLYRDWFQKITPLSVDDCMLKLGVANDFFGDWVKKNYDDLILDALKGIGGNDYDFEFESGHIPPDVPEPAPVATIIPEPELKVETPQPVKATPKRRGFMDEHTFDNFVVGAENRHAFAATKTAAEEPGLYNPLFLYGVSGVGKTHLLHAVMAYVRSHNPEAVVRYTTCDELLTNFYDLLQQRSSLSAFRSSVRDVDVLLVDDVHSLAKKTQMQEEFFNLFNTLYRNNHQIILTSDRQPCEISDLDKRLESRFESGMVAEVGVPGFEARLAILQMWRNQDVLNKSLLGDEFLEFLASSISSNVRRLHGAFLRLVSYASLNGKLTLEEAEELLHIQLAQESALRDISIEEVQRAVASHFGVTITDILGVKRSRGIAEPRMIAMYLCRELTGRSSTEVGTAFGRNHATVLHAEKKVPELCLDSETMRRSVSQLKHQLRRS